GSRSTVRQAVTQLVQNNVLEKKAGRGTFIARRPINDWLGSLKTTTETIEGMDMTSSIKLVRSEIVSLTGELKQIPVWTKCIILLGCVTRITYRLELNGIIIQ